jgi:glycosyltransferase involved in cell wall biosynthesis
VLVGACSLPPGWADLPNVHLLGQKDYGEVPQYMAACDVLIMPWNRSEWIEACNPVKLKEYLAVGRPVVSTPFPELARYEGYVRLATTGKDFAAAVREALAGGTDAERLRARVREETWDAKTERVLAELAARGVRPAEAVQRSGLGAPSSARSSK